MTGTEAHAPSTATNRRGRYADLIAASSPISASNSIAHATGKRNGSPRAPVVRTSAVTSSDRCSLLGLVELERDLVFVANVDRHLAAADQPAEQQLVGQRLADRVLYQARHRARAHLRVESLFRQELAQPRRERGLDLFFV